MGEPTAATFCQLCPGLPAAKQAVVSPLVGNGKLGWIQRSAVSLSHVNWQIDVSLSQRLTAE